MPLSSPIRLPLRLGLGALSRRRGGVAAFDPATLFASGEQGGWYDPSDLTTLFQDTAGTVPVTAAGQTVARINDKSGRGNHATQATAGNRAVLQQDSKGKYYLDCAGGAKFYNIPTINVSTDKATAFFAVKKNSSSARASIFETSPDYGRNGAIGILFPHQTAAQSGSVYVRGTTETAWFWTFPDGDTGAFSVQMDIAGADRNTEIVPLMNGVRPVVSPTGAAANAGTGNFLNYAYTLGARAGGSLPFAGRIYGFAIRFAQSTDLQISQMNDWMADKAGIDYLTGSDYLGFNFVAGQLTSPTLTSIANYSRASTITFSTTAVGAIPSGGGARPTLSLVNNSITHPKVLHIPSGFAGYKYWMAATPYFGVVGSESQYENPHIFCSNDGINFIEPPGITNPIDLAENEYPAHSYWSDTHLMLGDDGYLYCYYRGVGIAFGATPTNYYRRSLDGVNWSARTLLCNSNWSVSPVVMKTGSSSQIYYEVTLSTGRPVLRVPMTGPAAVSDKGTGTNIVLDSEPWASDQDIWHIDIDRFGGLTIAMLNTGPNASSGGNELWLAYSVDDLNFKVLPTRVGPATSNYRPTFVPVRLTESTLEIDVYASQTSGIVSVWRVVLAIS